MNKKRISSFLVAVLFLIQPVSAASSLTVHTITNNIDGPQLKYKCSYPRLNGISDEKAQLKLNIQLKEKAVGCMKVAEMAAKQLEESKTPVEGEFAYDIKRNENGILSMTLEEKLSAGGKRGLDTRTAMNINTVNGKILKLKDFFTGSADYRSTLGDEVKRQISRRGLDRKLIAEFQEIKPDEEFYMTKDSIVIIAQQYEYFPYDCGIQEFPIPLRSLDGILKPAYRLST